jgi:hypothetical protein
MTRVPPEAPTAAVVAAGKKVVTSFRRVLRPSSRGEVHGRSQPGRRKICRTRRRNAHVLVTTGAAITAPKNPVQRPPTRKSASNQTRRRRGKAGTKA